MPHHVRQRVLCACFLLVAVFESAAWLGGCPSLSLVILAVPAAGLQAARERLLAPGGRMTEEEAARIQAAVMAMPLEGGGTTGNLSRPQPE
jgi:hypothetical protein